MKNGKRKRAGPRYSIVPGDFVDDERATQLSHYRVILHLGRWTDKNGWFRRQRRQEEHAADLGMGRQCFNRALNALINWGYVERKIEHGRRYYRVLMDRGEPETFVDDEVSPRDDTSALSHTGDSELSSPRDIPDATLSVADDNGVASAATPNSDLSFRPQIFPPTPHVRARTRRERERRLIQSALDSLKRSHSRVVSHLLKPVLAQRRFDNRCPDPGEALQLFAVWAEQCNDRVLKNAATNLLRSRGHVVHAHDMQEAVRVEAQVVGTPIYDTPGAQKDFGGVIINEANKPAQFDAWLLWHQAERTSGRANKAGLMEAHRFILAPSEWPPRHKGEVAA